MVDPSLIRRYEFRQKSGWIERIAVSYTHLDVYKRQALSRTHSRRRRMSTKQSLYPLPSAYPAVIKETVIRFYSVVAVSALLY